MTLGDIENAGYRVFGAYGVDHRDFSHMWQIYEDYAYHGIIEVDGKKKFFRVTLIEDCPLYNVRIRIKTIDDLKAVLKEYFPVDSSDSHYYDMYNVQITNHYRTDAFVWNILKEYGFKTRYSNVYSENLSSYTRKIGEKNSIHLDVNTEEMKLCAYFGDYSFVEDYFKMWDTDSVKAALANVMLVPVMSEVGMGFDLLMKLNIPSEPGKIQTVDKNILSMFGGKSDDIKATLEAAKTNIEKLLETL